MYKQGKRINVRVTCKKKKQMQNELYTYQAEPSVVRSAGLKIAE